MSALLTIFLRMVNDVSACGDPTLTLGEEAFIWLARIMAALYDTVCV